MIGLDGLPDDFPPDMYVYHDRESAPAADVNSSPQPGNYMPRLLAELHRLRVIPEHWPMRRCPSGGSELVVKNPLLL